MSVLWTRACSMHCGTRREPRPFTDAQRPGVFSTGAKPPALWAYCTVWYCIVFFPLTFRIVLCIVFILIQNMKYKWGDSIWQEKG